METKYYTPTIDEFHVGLEYEWRRYAEDKFSFGRIKEGSQIDDITDGTYQLRIKHLDEQDILECGFKKISPYQFDKHLWRLVVKGNGKISFINFAINDHTLDMLIKNKSELKRLMKQLGINE